jgi:ElaB/YqjD/DUF883 family membrane-anchored ribosome-binding protein
MSTTMRKDEGGKAKDQASQAMDKGREAASHAADAASHAASAVGQKAQDLASSVAHKAQDAASSVAHKAQDLASNVGQKAEDATSAVGQGMHGVADKVREYGPSEGMLGSASRAVADTVDSAGRYLEDKNLSGMMDDVTGLIRRNPIPALLLGLGVGFLIGRALSSRS